nr:uncharacterized protein LOC113810159 [Penaeus vannamei]
MFAKLVLIAGCVLGSAWCLPRSKRDSTPTEYELPSNATLVLASSLRTGFTCDERVYGYYVDTENSCQVFHVCYPYVDVDLLIKVRMFSFICGEGLVFDQSRLVCDLPENSIPCDIASQYYDINNYFGREDLNFGEGEIPEAPERDFQIQTFAEFSRNLQ